MTDTDEPLHAQPEQVDLLTPASVRAYLVARRMIPSTAVEVEACELSGGVSNVVLAVRSPQLRLVVKQALPRLRVADEWLAKRERAVTEAEALEWAGEITPGFVPALVDLDRESCTLTLEAAPESWVSWKSRLLACTAEPEVAARLGELLAAWHRASYGDPVIAARFDDQEAFAQLRVDPFYLTVARRQPELAERIDGFVTRMAATHLCLVHGDYSPKNVLVGDGIWVIDFEVAHYGDPAFDLAFMLNHLMLKRIHVPAAAGPLARCMHAFWEHYAAAAPPALLPQPAYLFGHLGCLMVARVDGKSPAEYLTASEQTVVRKLGTELVLDPPGSLEAVLERVGNAVA